jgi:hypothetical protein
MEAIIFGWDLNEIDRLGDPGVDGKKLVLNTVI